MCVRGGCGEAGADVCVTKYGVQLSFPDGTIFGKVEFGASLDMDRMEGRCDTDFLSELNVYPPDSAKQRLFIALCVITATVKAAPIWMRRTQLGDADKQKRSS